MYFHPLSVISYLCPETGSSYSWPFTKPPSTLNSSGRTTEPESTPIGKPCSSKTGSLPILSGFLSPR